METLRFLLLDCYLYMSNMTLLGCAAQKFESFLKLLKGRMGQTTDG